MARSLGRALLLCTVSLAPSLLAGKTDLGFEPNFSPVFAKAPAGNFLGTVDYMMDDDFKKAAKGAVEDQAAAAAWLRDSILNPIGNESSAAMLDYLFRGGFSTSEDFDANMGKVVGAFDAMSRAAAVNPDDNPQTEAPLQLLQLSDGERKMILGSNTDAGASAYQDIGLIFISNLMFKIAARFDSWLGFNSDNLCKKVKLSSRWIWPWVISHEMAHLAGVQPSQRYPELYGLDALLKATPDHAINNADTYAWAILFQASGCAHEFFPMKASRNSVQNPRNGRKLLTKQDTFPVGDEVVTEDLAALLPAPMPASAPVSPERVNEAIG